MIYIRHGEPSSRASYAAPGLEPNESWRYSRPDGDLIFHFMAREDVQDFKLVESLFDVLGFSNALALKGEGLADADVDPMAQQLLLSREQLAPIYGRLQSAGRISNARYQDEERQVGQDSIALGTTTDSYELRVPRRAEGEHRGARRRPRLHRTADPDRLRDLRLDPGARARHSRLPVLPCGSASSPPTDSARSRPRSIPRGNS